MATYNQRVDNQYGSLFSAWQFVSDVVSDTSYFK